MDRRRLKHAWARGARIQCRYQDTGVHWTPSSRFDWSVRPDARIHPDDAHLEYGPLSTALRTKVTRDNDTIGFLDYQAAWVFVQALIPRKFIALCDEDALILDCLMLFVAEFLADEGL